MRVFLTVVGLPLLLIVPWAISAQDKTDKEKSPPSTSRNVLANLQHEVKSADFGDAMKFSEFLQMTREVLQNNNKPVTMVMDDEAFREENPDLKDILEHQIHLRNLPARASVQLLLRQALKQLPVKSAYVIRAGKVDIVPYARTGKEYMLNQTFFAEFKERRLDQALEELSELTGVSIVVDARAKQKTQTPVTARFNDDVALQDAVRMLTDMAELKMVYLVTGIYVTTPERAQTLQKELKHIYEGETPAVAAPAAGPGPIGPGGIGAGPRGLGGPVPDPIMVSPLESPLAPPLPPRPKRLEPAA
jgi:D-ribose pyranose/furanose isomerase RbsD